MSMPSREDVKEEEVKEVEWESGYENHAMKEFQILGWVDKNDQWMQDQDGDSSQEMICKNILEVLKTIASQGHTGFTIGYLMQKVQRLVDFKPIAPLTGEDDEWRKCPELKGEMYQNKRFSAVFKDGKDGAAYWQSGKVFVDNTGSYTKGRESHVPVTFPFYVPDKPEFVDLRENGHPDPDMD